MRAAASAASHPACPAPTIMTSNFCSTWNMLLAHPGASVYAVNILDYFYKLLILLGNLVWPFPLGAHHYIEPLKAGVAQLARAQASQA